VVINLKKVVVVIDDGRTVTFEGKNMKISNNTDGYLIIRDMAKKVGVASRALGVFRSWLYWMEVEQKGSEKKETEITYGETDKLRLINKSGVCVASLYILPDGNLKDDSWIRTKRELCQHCGKSIEPNGGNILCRDCSDNP